VGTLVGRRYILLKLQLVNKMAVSMVRQILDVTCDRQKLIKCTKGF
jgi:hypothetical protein